MTRKPASWELLATAPDQLTAEMWKELLEGEGIPALVPEATFSFLGPSPVPCRLLVPEHRLEEAKAVLESLTAAPEEEEEQP